MAGRNRVVQYPAEQAQRVIGPARCGQAVFVEPASDTGAGDPVQRQRAEGGKQVRGDDPGDSLSRRRLAPVETRPPRTCGEVRERRGCAAVHLAGRRPGLDGEALGARFLDARQRRRTEGDPSRAAFDVPPIHEGPVTRRPDAYAETGVTRVPDRILAGRRRQSRDIGVGQTPALRSHVSTLEGSADDTAASRTIASDRCVYFSVVAGLRCPSRRPMVSTVSPCARAMLA